MRERIDIGWMPEAKSSWQALKAQQEIILAHIERVKARRDRFREDSIAWSVAHLEMLTWQQIADILTANLGGRTVQPS